MTQTSTEDKRATWKIPEAAQIAGCGQRALRDEIAKGKVPHLRFGRNILIPRQAFLRYLDNGGKI